MKSVVGSRWFMLVAALCVGMVVGRMSAEDSALSATKPFSMNTIAVPGPRVENKESQDTGNDHQFVERAPHELSDSVTVTRVIDGDTIEIEGGERVRYIGIDTPESVDPRRLVECLGKESAARNRELVDGKEVRLVADTEDTDTYGRLLRYVYLPDGSMVNEVLLREGFANLMTIAPNVSEVNRLRQAEQYARQQKVGLWSTVCADHGTMSASSAKELAASVGAISKDSSGGSVCMIKGNISSSGEKIYHAPECPYYERTKIDSTHGEAFFCTEEEAQQSGFRRAKNCP